MAPTEASILSDFLLAPASLPTILPLEKFTELFPRAQRSNPQVKLLYRELQHLRATDIEIVRENIAKEVIRGERQMTAIHKAWSAGQKSSNIFTSRDVDMDVGMFGATSNLPTAEPHTIASMLPDMEKACSDLEKEIEQVEGQAFQMLEEMEATVGELSDLRYGKFNKPAGSNGTVAEEVIDGLRRLEEACQNSASEN